MNVYLARRRVKVEPRKSLGKGGEADVFDLGDGRALKLFKDADHPDYQGLPLEQAAARARLEEHQVKLRRFPTGLPPAVVAPDELATDRGGRVLGYAMRKVDGAEPLFRLADPAFRRAGFPAQDVAALFVRIHRTLAALHGAGVVVGDFNDRNVLVAGGEGFLIDADSFQFGPFRCAVFTDRFVDPLLCEAGPGGLAQVRPYGTDSDWYAFAVLLMQSLLFVGPYGGVHRPKGGARRIVQGARPLERLSVFHPEVQYPKPAASLGTLPDELLHRLQRVFVEDERGPFPLPLLEGLRFTRCAGCGTEHARLCCPVCRPTAAASTTTAARVRGEVLCQRLYSTRGVVLHAAVEGGTLRWLAYEGGEFRREDGAVVLRGRLDPAMRFALNAEETLIGRRGELVALRPGGGAPRRLAAEAFASAGGRTFWIEDGRLHRDGPFGPEPVGEVLAGQTRFWTGPCFGFGHYRAGTVCVAFVFEGARGGLNDALKLPPLPGQLLDADCALDDRRAWLRLALAIGGRTRHLCLVWSRQGELEAVAEADAGDPGWLGALGGACAVGGMLLVATDAGVVRVEAAGGALAPTREFADTEPFVSSDCRLLVGKEGLVVVRPQEIVALQMP